MLQPIVATPRLTFIGTFANPVVAGRQCAHGGGGARRDVAGADANDWVLVHDAARCLIEAEDVKRLIRTCEHDAVGGLLALPLPDTLKAEAHGRVAATVDRSDKWLAQTPQMFRLGALHAALSLTADRGFAGVTDEASAMEMAGHAPQLVRGSAQNFKVTYPEDFALAEAVLRSRP